MYQRQKVVPNLGDVFFLAPDNVEEFLDLYPMITRNRFIVVSVHGKKRFFIVARPLRRKKGAGTYSINLRGKLLKFHSHSWNSERAVKIGHRKLRVSAKFKLLSNRGL